MNWPKIWIGAGLAAAALLVIDLINVVLAQTFFGASANLTARELGTLALFLVGPSLIGGFLVSWLYALARPRLGPGPKTALVMGTIAFALANQHVLSPTLWLSSLGMAVYQVILPWIKYAAATYLAGWQYIEKA